MIKLKCPSCAKPLGIDEAYIGKPALCPGCSATFIVPAPAVMLEDHPAPAPVMPPLPSREPVLPEGPVGLTPMSGTGAALAGVGFGGPSDPWASTQARQRSPQAPLPDVSLLPLGPTPAQSNQAIPDWRFLALEEDAPAPTPPPLPRAEPAPTAESVPLLLPPALATDKVLVPVRLAEAGSYDVLGHEAPGVPIPELPLVPGDAVSRQPLLDAALPPLPALAVPPVPPATPAPVPGYGKLRKRKLSDGGQLIPGVDNFYFGLAGLGVLCLLFLLLMLRAPELFLLPMLLGLAVLGTGGFKVRPRFDPEDGEWWLTVPLQPFALLVYPVVQRKGFGPFLALLAGLLLVVTGVVGMAKDFDGPTPAPRRGPAIQRQ